LSIVNLTLACLIIIGAFLAFGLKQFLPFLLVITVLSSQFNFDTDYYTNRLSDKDETNNISRLVWVQGWEEAQINFYETDGLGVGFQQFGINTPKGETSRTILYLLKDYTNILDGGTFGAKLLGEFGIFGLVLIGLIVYQSTKSLFFLRSKKNILLNSPQLIFYHCCIAYFILELCVRSMSYMAPGFFMFMVGINGVAFKKEEFKNSKLLAQ